MNSFINYVIEANLVLIFFSAGYFLLFHRETQFHVQRIYLIAAMLAAILFPLTDIQSLIPQVQTTSTVRDIYLPELIVGEDTTTKGLVTTSSGSTIGEMVLYAYFAVTGVLLLRFIIQVSKLLLFFKRQSFYVRGRLHITETNFSTTFSFFNFIVIGNSDHLDEREKEKIIEHEKTHARSFHSFDIILSELFIIAFWFNPLVYIIKKQLIRVHEFEADQQSIEHGDVKAYCAMLTRVALITSGFRFVNHFNNSLTLKRIAMINTHKAKMKRWKYAAIVHIFLTALAVDAYSDPSVSLAKSDSHGLNFPGEVKMLLETVENYTLPDGTLRTKLTDLEDWAAKHPDAKFFVEKVEVLFDDLKAREARVIDRYKKEYKKAEGFQSYAAVVNKDTGTKWEYAYIIYAITDHKVERTLNPDYGNRTDLPYYWGGPEAMNAYLAKKIKYPAAAAVNKIEGTVLISFVVDTGGNVIDPRVSKGIGYGCDEEALAAVAGFPKWRPGMHDNVAVNVRYIVPINFQLPEASK